jgi:class 3 adenylate cyclase
MKRHRLLIYQEMSQRLRTGLFALLLLVILPAAASLLLPFVPARALWLLLFALVFSLWLYYAVLFPRSALEIHRNYLRVQGPVFGLSVGYELVASVVPAFVGDHFSPAELKAGDIRYLAPILNKTAVLILLKRAPHLLAWHRLWLPRFFFGLQEPSLLLAVADWTVALGDIQEAWSQWQRRSGRPGVTVRPAQTEPEAVTRPAADDEVAAERPPGTSLILVAEDNQAIRELLGSLLSRQYQVVTAGDGADALKKAMALKPDLILTDLVMPRMDGRELLLQLRQHPSMQSTPVVVLTAQTGREARLESLDAGADDYLTKPFDERELMARVKNLVRARSQERELAELNQLLEAQIEEQTAKLVRTDELKHFLPRPVAESVISGEIGPAQFERRITTVLYVDIVGFTPLTGQLKPWQLASFLNDYLREMAGVANVYNGTVDKFMGDALMVLYGAPKPLGPRQQAWAAIQSAVVMRRQVRDLSRRWRRELPGEVQVRVAINTGECTVGVFGNDLLQNYTAIGAPVNLAARLQKEAQPDSILVGPATYSLVAQLVKARPVGPLHLPGIPQPISAYSITGFADQPAKAGLVAAAQP